LKSDSKREELLREHYRVLFAAWGRQHWWPARTRFEVIVGAFLTQNTAWKNVELALRRLRAARLLNVAGVRDASASQLEAAIRSAGYFRQKTRSLKNFVAFLDEHYRGSLSRMFAQPTEKLRAELLSLKGSGPETADSILLYAGQHPVFVVDAYTRRILERHAILPAKSPYDEVRRWMERALRPLADTTLTEAGKTGTSKPETTVSGARHPPSRMSLARRSPTAQIYNEMHGLIVGVGKSYCLKSNPRCDECPLQRFLPPL